MSKRKILIISFCNPYPPNSGGRISLFGSIDYLRAHYDITLVVKSNSEANTAGNNAIKEIWKDVNIKEYFPPKTKQKTSSGLSKIKTSVKKLIQPKQSIRTNSSSKYFELPPVVFDEDFISFLYEVINEQTYDIIQIEHTNNLSLIKLLPENCQKIFVQIEGRYLVVADYLQSADLNSGFKQYILENVKSIENSYMDMYDAVIALNKKDEESLKETLPNAQVFQSPFGLLDSKLKKNLDAKQFQLEKIIFLGSEGHYPNKDGLKWFLEEILSQIDTDIQVHITGKWSQEFKESFQDNTRVVFTGYLDSIEKFIENSVLVVPIRIGGGGIRAKVLEGMGAGIPIVSTTLGCEGVNGLAHNQNMLIADDAESFATCINRLIADGELRENIIDNAYNLILKNYSQTETGKLRMKVYQQLLNEKVVTEEINLTT